MRKDDVDRMWLSPIVFDDTGTLGAPFLWSNGSDDLNMSDGLLLGGGHLEVGQGSNVFELFNLSQPVLEDVGLAGLCEPIHPNCDHVQEVPDPQSRLAGLHLDQGKFSLGLLFVMFSTCLTSR